MDCLEGCLEFESVGVGIGRGREHSCELGFFGVSCGDGISRLVRCGIVGGFDCRCVSVLIRVLSCGSR